MDAGKEKLAAGLHDIRTRSLLEHDYVSHVRLLRPPVRSCHLQRPLKHAACGSVSSDAACGAVVNARGRRRRWPRAVSLWSRAGLRPPPLALGKPPKTAPEG